MEAFPFSYLMYKEMVEVNKFVTLATESPENMVT
jgi:hypothetical protein